MRSYAVLTSYLSGRSQYVRTSATSSTPSAVLYGVPQGSVLGPILFVLYTADVLQLVRDHDLIPHAFADDTQILTTHRFLVPAVPRTVKQCRIWCPTVSTMCPRGCQPTGCSSTTVRLKHSGVLVQSTSISDFELATLLCSQLLSFGISESTSTPR